MFHRNEFVCHASELKKKLRKTRSVTSVYNNNAFFESPRLKPAGRELNEYSNMVSVKQHEKISPKIFRRISKSLRRQHIWFLVLYPCNLVKKKRKKKNSLCVPEHRFRHSYLICFHQIPQVRKYILVSFFLRSIESVFILLKLRPQLYESLTPHSARILLV